MDILLDVLKLLTYALLSVVAFFVGLVVLIIVIGLICQLIGGIRNWWNYIDTSCNAMTDECPSYNKENVYGKRKRRKVVNERRKQARRSRRRQ